MSRRTRLMIAVAVGLIPGAAYSTPPAANPWAGNSPPSADASRPTLIIRKLGSSLRHMRMTEVGSAGSVPGTQQAGFHTNNGGMGGAMEDGDVGTNPQRTGGDDSRDDYTYSDGTSISVPKGDSPPSDTSGFSSDGGGAKGGLGRVWAVICQAAGCGGGDGDSTERAVTGTRGQGNPLDFGTSGGASTNGNGKTVNLGSRGGNDGGGSDQGGRSGAATANGTGQTVNRGNKGGGDALAQGPAPAEQLNGNKLLNGAVDPKRDGPH